MRKTETYKPTDWDRRIVDFGVIHGDSEKAYDALISALNLRNGQRIGDFMCGYGEVSRRILAECDKKGTSIDLYLLDSSPTQLGRTLDLKPNRGTIERTLGDARNYPFINSYFHNIIIKMGLHEVGPTDQKAIIRNAVRTLKLGGSLFVWDAMGETPESNGYFRRVVRLKDQLAGFKQMASERHFSTGEEIVANMVEEGLETGVVYGEPFFIEKKDLADLDDDPEAKSLFIDRVEEMLPEKVKDRICFIKEEDDFSMFFAQKIFVGRKKEETID